MGCGGEFFVLEAEVGGRSSVVPGDGEWVGAERPSKGWKVGVDVTAGPKVPWTFEVEGDAAGFGERFDSDARAGGEAEVAVDDEGPAD